MIDHPKIDLVGSLFILGVMTVVLGLLI